MTGVQTCALPIFRRSRVWNRPPSTALREAQANLEETLLSNPAWASLSAVEGGRFHTLERRMFSLKPNALWGDAYEQLADILCGE